jgi:hypothetical protein
MLNTIRFGARNFSHGYFEPEIKLSLELGALFHEADDRKYFA